MVVTLSSEMIIVIATVGHEELNKAAATAGALLRRCMGEAGGVVCCVVWGAMDEKHK
jgi:hypothetical protein